MASRVQTAARLLYLDNRLLAFDTCEWLAKPGGQTSESWHAFQVTLWLELAEAEDRLRKLRKRTKRRSRRWRLSSVAKNASPELRQAHLAAMKSVATLLEERQSIIKQAGDALAWNLARNDLRFILPLYKPSTHQLPLDHSVDGVLRMLETAAGTSDYMIVPTDLTRCCGTGDFLILGARWPHPSPFEAKVKKQPDGTLFNFLYGSNIAFQVLPDEMEKFATAFGMSMPGKVSFDERGERQKVEVNEGTFASAKSFMSIAQHADPAIRRNWKNLAAVISRAVRGQAACDLAEPGLAYLAIPLKVLSGRSDVVSALHGILEENGIASRENDWNLSTSLELCAGGQFAALVSPFALWKLPLAHKAALIVGDIIVGSASRRGIWRDAFRDAGVELSENEDGTWKLAAAGREMVFDALDVLRLKIGLTHAGASPRYTAWVAGMQLYHPGSVSIDRYGVPGREHRDNG